ncbi:autotransporter domain-containing protein [Rhodopseudomonas palustris]|uniref:autotransporter domain-containing protein n=1 Tax=Rhodopseudomonas palustris TaxID=1076 RepID=UPI0014038B85|nr:autotransporter domain-containing protein [Rhodopseudomonas palustris]QLH72452.1 autotransporter domain-containing protein [Rhodopseudomonas palustris]
MHADIDNYGLLTGINSNPGQAVEFSTLTNTTIGSVITVGSLPRNAVFSPDGRYAYVVNNGGSVSVLDVAAHTVVGTIGVGTDSSGIAISPDGKFVYVTNYSSNSVSVISSATNQVVSSISASRPYGIAVSADGGTLYVTNLQGASVTVIDAASGTALTSVSVGISPVAVVVSRDGSRIYVSNEGNGGSLSVVDTASRTVVATINGPAGNAALSPDGSRLYVTDQGSTLYVIDTAANRVLTTVTLPDGTVGITVSADGSRVYVSSGTGATVLDAATNNVIATVSTPISGNLSFGTGWIGPNVIVAAGGAVSASSDAALTALGFGQYVNFNGGTVKLDGSFSTARTISLLALGGVIDTSGFNLTLNGTIINDGQLTKAGLGILTLTGANTYAGGTLVTGGLINFNALNNFGSGRITLDGGGLQWATGTSTDVSSRLAAIGSGGATFDTNGSNVTFTSGLSGVGGITKAGAGSLVLSTANTYTGATLINAGTLALSGAGSIASSSGVTVGAGASFDISGITAGATIATLAGAGTVALGNRTLTLSSASTAFDGVMTGIGGLTLATGRQTLTGTNSYSGPTTVNAGMLIVNGSIVHSATSVGSGGTLAGTGTAGNVTVASGGTLAPGSGVAGTSLSIAGSLAFQSGALYQIQVSPSAASLANVSGAATLAGTVQAVLSPGSYLTKTYTILTAASRSGTFDGLTTSGLPAGFQARLDYSVPNSVMLDLQAGLGGTDGLNLNQRRVANSLNNYFNAGGSLPPAFVGLFGLTGSQLGTALSQLSGEAATGAQQSAFQMGTAFLGLMTDPFVEGRAEAEDAGALGYAPERGALPAGIASAYAAITKAPPRPMHLYEPRWSLWGAAYGGGSRIDGDAAIGSNDLTSRSGGVAAGADYQLSPYTRFGFALAGGQSSWNVGQGLGSGRGDAFQIGVNARTSSGPAYLAASLAFANYWMSTDRMSFAATRSTASFDAQSYGGRLEAGWRFASPLVAVTPYAAVTAQWFDTPAYSETSPSGLFGLNYASRGATDTRGETGARFDRSVALDSGTALILRAKLAYAHDWISDPSLPATFQVLPGASFIVSGAAPTRDSGLASVGAELRFAGGLVISAKFDGEFAAHAQTYAGTATLRYLW